MPQYFSPGVYVEEVDAGPRPIQGVSTSVTGAVGVTQRGPVDGKPVLVTSFAEYKRVFGGYLASETTFNAKDIGAGWLFPNAVQGFFENGGQQLYVKRVTAGSSTGTNTDDATPSSVSMKKGLYARILDDVNKRLSPIALSVDHAVGIRTDSANTVVIENGENGKIIAQGDVKSIDGANTKIKLVVDANMSDDIKVTRGDYVQILSTPTDEVYKFEASSPGKWGDDLRVRVLPSVRRLRVLRNSDITPAQTAVASKLSIASTSTGAKFTLTFPANQGLIAGDFVDIGGERLRLADLAPPDSNKFEVERDATATQYAAGTLVTKLLPAVDSTARQKLFVAGIQQLYVGALVEISKGGDKVLRHVVEVNRNSIKVDSQLENDKHFEGDSIYLLEATVEVEYSSDGVNQSEQFGNQKITALSASNDPNDPRLLHNAIGARSALVSVPIHSYANTFATFGCGTHPDRLFGFESFGNGDDKFANLAVDDFIGVDGGSGQRTGIKSLEDIEDISLVMVPGVTSRPVISELLRHCDLMRYRMAILDSERELKIQEVREFRSQFDSERAALYYPWVKTRQPGVSQEVAVPPSGHMAGVYADVDSRRGYHKAPANEIIKGITQIDREVNRQEQDLLNPEGINALRFFPGRGNRVWGARTISSNSNFKYVNVRRIFNFIERSIDEGTQFVVFEPNNPELWSRVRQTITNFLNTQWRAGALEGRTPDEAFFVACDRGTTMTQDDIENGRLICSVGIAPVFPAEFVIFRVQKYTADSKLA